MPYLLRERADIPVVGSKLTLAFIDAKLKEHRITPRARGGQGGRRSDPSARSTCEFVAVNHSIPDGLAVAIRTAAGLVLHTGDFKMDQFPLDGRITDLRGFARLGEEGVDLFLTDSTNAEVPGFTTSERDLTPAIETVFRTAPRRVIVSSFASHVHRIQQVLDAAHAHGRKVAFVGRSMVRNMGIARDLGYLKVPEGLVVDLKQLEKLPDDKITLVCTGSQGEPMAALSRMANRDHMIRIGEGDTVLLASSLIPGNENAIYRRDQRAHPLGRQRRAQGQRQGARLRARQRRRARLLLQHRPAPQRHAGARRVAAPARQRRARHPDRRRRPRTWSSPRTASSSTWSTGTAKITGKVPAGYVYVDGTTVGGATEASLKDRRTLAEEGVITVVAIVDADTGKLAEPPDFLARGFVHDEHDLRRRRARHREGAGQGRAAEGIGDAAPARAAAAPRRRPLGAAEVYRRSPLIIPVVIDA